MKGKDDNSFCNDIEKILKQMTNLAEEHCSVADEVCKDYCEKYCDHFYVAFRDNYRPVCPAGINETQQLFPINKDIDEYLDKYLANENCRDTSSLR